MAAQMTTQQWLDVFDECRRLGVRLLSFGGREPLLRKDIFSPGPAVKSFEFQLDLTANGLAVCPDDTARIMDHFDFVVVPRGSDCERQRGARD